VASGSIVLKGTFIIVEIEEARELRRGNGSEGHGQVANSSEESIHGCLRALFSNFDSSERANNEEDTKNSLTCENRTTEEVLRADDAKINDDLGECR